MFVQAITKIEAASIRHRFLKQTHPSKNVLISTRENDLSVVIRLDDGSDLTIGILDCSDIFDKPVFILKGDQSSLVDIPFLEKDLGISFDFLFKIYKPVVDTKSIVQGQPLYELDIESLSVGRMVIYNDGDGDVGAEIVSIYNRNGMGSIAIKPSQENKKGKGHILEFPFSSQNTYWFLMRSNFKVDASTIFIN